MKLNSYYLSVAVIAVVSSIFGTWGIAQAQLQNIQVNPDVFKNPQVPQLKLAASLYGEVNFSVVPYGRKVPCHYMEVYLISEEYTVRLIPDKPAKTNRGLLHIPIFSYKQKLSPTSTDIDSNSKNYKCNYSISVDEKFVVKKAKLGFVTDYGSCVKADDKIIIPDKDVRKDYKETLCGLKIAVEFMVGRHLRG
jgi:hypothetical protein